VFSTTVKVKAAVTETVLGDVVTVTDFIVDVAAFVS
jgi:hypothetical protein